MDDILMLGDSAGFSNQTAARLEQDGYTVRQAAGLADLPFSSNPIVLVILEYRLGARNGFEAITRLRERHPGCGIIIVSDTDDPVDQILSLEVGADDYVAHQEGDRVLLARVHSLIRRMKDAHARIESLGRTAVFEDYRVDLETLNVTRGEASIALSNNEFKLLQLFLSHPGETLSRETISINVFRRAWQPADRHVDVLVGKLRSKLGDSSRHRIIRTYRGVGYRFAASASWE